jgi:hypothetical protein
MRQSLKATNHNSFIIFLLRILKTILNFATLMIILFIDPIIANNFYRIGNVPIYIYDSLSSQNIKKTLINYLLHLRPIFPSFFSSD